MEEILVSVQQRVTRTQDIVSRGGVAGTESTQGSAYDQIRKFREEEKQRVEKENWILNIMKNIRVLSPEQQIHIYKKTTEILAIVGDHPTETEQWGGTGDFYEAYLRLFDEYAVKPQTRQLAKQGQIAMITDLLKLLIAKARNEFQSAVMKLSGSAHEAKPQSQMVDSRRVILPARKLEAPQLPAKAPKPEPLKPEPPQDSPSKQDKQIRILKVALQKRPAEIPAVVKRATENSATKLRKIIVSLPSRPPEELTYSTNDTSALLLLESIKPVQAAKYFIHITPIIGDLDDQYCTVMEYQSIKRPNQSAEEMKNNFDHFYEKIKVRNALIATSCSNYRCYITRRSVDGDKETADWIRYAFDKINVFHVHLCLKLARPIPGQHCECLQDGYSFQHTVSKSCSYSPTKFQAPQKFLVRKSQQSLLKRSNCNNVHSYHAVSGSDTLQEPPLNQRSILQVKHIQFLHQPMLEDLLVMQRQSSIQYRVSAKRSTSATIKKPYPYKNTMGRYDESESPLHIQKIMQAQYNLKSEI